MSLVVLEARKKFLLSAENTMRRRKKANRSLVEYKSSSFSGTKSTRREKAG